jgi:hypothetical protein
VIVVVVVVAVVLTLWLSSSSSSPCDCRRRRRRRLGHALVRLVLTHRRCRPHSGLPVPVASRSSCGVLAVPVGLSSHRVVPSSWCVLLVLVPPWSRPHTVWFQSRAVGVLLSRRGPGLASWGPGLASCGLALVSWSWSRAVVLVSHRRVWLSHRVVLPSRRGPGLAPWVSTLASCGPTLTPWGPALVSFGPGLAVLVLVLGSRVP